LNPEWNGPPFKSIKIIAETPIVDPTMPKATPAAAPGVKFTVHVFEPYCT